MIPLIARFSTGQRLLCLAVFLLAGSTARAGLTFELHLVRFSQGQTYRFFTPLTTNSTPPDAPLGTYLIYSPQQPTNGSWRAIEISTNGANTVDGAENSYSDFNSVMQQITNGTWRIAFTNAITTNFYSFTVSAPDMTSNLLPATFITYPVNGASDVPVQPTLTWEPPPGWGAVVTNTFLYDYDFSFYQPVSTSPGQTNWTLPSPMPNGLEANFTLSYITNDSPTLFVATTPLNTNAPHAPISGWVSTDALESSDFSAFSVTNPPVISPLLVARYTFDSTNNPGQDSSGNGYDLDFNGGNQVTLTNDAKVGTAAYFDGNSFFAYASPPTNLLHVLAGDFSLAFWIKTSQDSGNENGPAWAGAGIVAADIPGNHYDSVPAALDGGQIGFNTGGDFSDDTANSTIDINQDSHYHQIVITRLEATGEKRVYVDGVLSASDFATTRPLSDPRTVAVGCAIDASQADPNFFNPNQFFQGALDDLQIYAGVITSNQVSSLFNNPGSAINASPGSGLVVHYTFDQTNNLGADSSGNGYDLNFNGGNGVTRSTDTVAGSGAASFDGASFLSYNSMPSAVLKALAGNFSLSFWIKTTQNDGNENGPAWAGAGIVAADIPGTANDLVPAALDGGQIGFNTGGGGGDDTLNSLTDVNDGATYHHVVVTRNQATGEKKVYIDGAFNNSDVANTNLLNDPVLVAVGCAIDASQADPNNASPQNFFHGLLDDLQIYSVVLTSNQVSQLFQNPGSVISLGISDFNSALNTVGLPWNTGGDAAWAIETTNSMDGLAASSGSVTNSQSSFLSTTITGPGTLTFYWSSIAEDPNAGFDFEFAIDNADMNDLFGDNNWSQAGPYTVGPGPHALTWTVFANGDTDTNQAGFLDEVNFQPATAPVILFNPFDQTNYPGYPVWLAAGATSNPTANWQWYKDGAGAIAGATNSYFSPTNSGTPGVAGSYYAIATNIAGATLTATASVSFVSAPLPPDWARAFKSPFYPVDSTKVTRDYYYGCVVDASSNIYTAAEFGGATTVGSQTLISGAGGDAAAIVKQSPTGSPLWAVGITNNGTGSSYAECVALAPGGGVYVAGNFSSDNWLGTNHLTDAGGGDIFLARFDATGSNVWLKTFGGTNLDFTIINSLTADPTGNVTLCGLLGGGPVSIGTSNYNVVGQQGVIIHLDSSGAVLWSQLVPSAFPQYLVSSAGRLYLSLNTATTGGTTNVVIGGISNVTDRAWAVAALDETTGQALWVRGVGGRSGAGSTDPYATGLIDDAPRLAVSGTNLFLTGVAYDSNAIFGPLTVNFALPRGQYFARFDTNGNPHVATTYGSVTTTPFSAVANANGDLYVSGDFDTYSFFGRDMIAAPSHPKLVYGEFSQAFLAKFDINGNPLWARQAVAPQAVNFLGIALAADGVWASGWGVSTNASSFQAIVFGTNSVFSDAQVFGGGAGGSVFFVFYPGGVLAKIIDTNAVAAPQPITLTSPHNNGTNFQFSFQTQSGFTHAVQYRTNLLFGTGWQTYTNVPGDGSIQTIPIPYSLFIPSRTGFIRVMTQ